MTIRRGERLFLCLKKVVSRRKQKQIGRTAWRRQRPLFVFIRVQGRAQMAQRRNTAIQQATRPTQAASTKPRHSPAKPMTVSPELARRFAAEYITDLNATQAYLRATGTTNAASAAVAGCRLRRHP